MTATFGIANLAKLDVVARLRARLDEHRRRLDDHVDRINHHEERLNRQLARLDAFQRRLDEWSMSAARGRVEYVAAAHQITAFEKRLADLESAQVIPGDDAAHAEARDIVESVRSEHARVRARLTLLGAYEERLRRVESALLHAIKVDRAPEPPNEAVDADVIEARVAGRIAPGATELPTTELPTTELPAPTPLPLVAASNGPGAHRPQLANTSRRTA